MIVRHRALQKSYGLVDWQQIFSTWFQADG